MADLPPALLDAVAFAARAHAGHLRKDRQTPYVSHVVRVCLIVRHLFEVDDPKVLMAALLHDTVEDTTTDFDDIEECFGTEVAGWVAALSKDKRRREDEREQAYCEVLRTAGWQVRICKLADLYDNLTDSQSQPPEQKQRMLQCSRHYLDALAVDLPPEAATAYSIVRELWERLHQSSS